MIPGHLPFFMGNAGIFGLRATISSGIASVKQKSLMKKTVLFTCMTFLTLSNLEAQVNLPYATGFDNGSQQNGWQQFRKGDESEFYQWEFSNSNAFSAPGCLIHNYPVGGQDPMDDWFVSPAFNIAAGGSLDSMRYAFNVFGTPQAGDTVFLYLLQGSADPDLATSKMVLHEFSGANYQNDNMWRLLNPIALQAQTGNSYLAIRYKTIINWLDVRFDNIAISGISLAGIVEMENEGVRVYPNPVTDQQVRFQFDAGKLPVGGLTLAVYNAAGQRVYTAPVVGNGPIDLPVASGFYTYQLQDNASTPVFQGKLTVQ